MEFPIKTIFQQNRVSIVENQTSLPVKKKNKNEELTEAITLSCILPPDCHPLRIFFSPMIVSLGLDFVKVKSKFHSADS